MKTTISIIGMTCAHCVKRIENALGAEPGVSSVIVNLEQKNAVVEHSSNVSASNLIAAVIEAGYEVANEEHK